ncbi:MAG: aminotransferase class V-fold PLP-dependent enzyme [Spirochaetota bacterium]
MSTESRFLPYRRSIVGIDAMMRLASGAEAPLVYADWTASGRLYGPIEHFMLHEVGPLVANTHTETTYSGVAMTKAYHGARDIIRQAVNAADDDSVLFSGFGMTSAINKLQRIIGLRLQGRRQPPKTEGKRPLVLVTHMEHHSNQITWEECNADVRIVPRSESTGMPDLEWLDRTLADNGDRPLLIGAFTAASNVTGIMTDYYAMAAIMHRHGGLCFVDFAAAAPYIAIDMHPLKREERLDAITFSPHKFLGGPGSSGILILSNSLYSLEAPDHPGGGTVKWTTPFGTHRYVDSIEAREDGGTPGFLQAIRAALALKLKEAMGIEAIRTREEELKSLFLEELGGTEGLELLESANMRRLGILSFHCPNVHYNLVVRLLNDRYGIQTRGGCSCAGTYGHVLFHITKPESRTITDLIDAGDLSRKPGWVRISLHPTMTNEEVAFVAKALRESVEMGREWASAYDFDLHSGEYIPRFPAVSPPDLINSFRPLA